MNPKSLLVLCCHGVYNKDNFYADRPYERDVYLDHIKFAFSLMKNKEYDVLVISGGCTKSQIEKSEARGYLDWADNEGLVFGNIKVLLEEHALTSSENLLFSMCRFYQYFGEFPNKVGSCTLVWKKPWQEKVIATALHLPNFQVVTVKDEWEKLKKFDNLFSLYTKDLLTTCDSVLKNNENDPLELKKDISKRDIWKKGQPYACIKELQPLFNNLAKLRENANNTSMENPLIKYPWET